MQYTDRRPGGADGGLTYSFGPSSKESTSFGGGNNAVHGTDGLPTTANVVNDHHNSLM